MDLISFVFVPQPNLVRSGLWGNICEFSAKTRSGNNEDFFVFAINCRSRNEIASIIMNIMYEKITSFPSEENVLVAAWSSWCTNLLLQSPEGRVMNEYSYNYLCTKANIRVSRYDIMYLPADDANWPYFIESIRDKMQ